MYRSANFTPYLHLICCMHLHRIKPMSLWARWGWTLSPGQFSKTLVLLLVFKLNFTSRKLYFLGIKCRWKSPHYWLLCMCNRLILKLGQTLQIRDFRFFNFSAFSCAMNLTLFFIFTNIRKKWFLVSNYMTRLALSFVDIKVQS